MHLTAKAVITGISLFPFQFEIKDLSCTLIEG